MPYGDHRSGANSAPLTNLLTETVRVLEKHGKSLDDIVYVGDKSGCKCIPLNKLVSVLNVDYNAGYGSVIIPPSLIISLANGDLLQRWSSEGMEGWDYVKTNPANLCREIIEIGGGTLKIMRPEEALC